MKISSTQRQLLELLQIPMLQLHPSFQSAGTSSDTEKHTSTALSEPELQSPLAQDILLAMGSLKWQINSELLQPQLQLQTVITPELVVLRQSEQKKQLWRLLVGADAGRFKTDILDPEHGSD